MAYDSSSRIEPKRSHQWFLDGTEEELFSNKKQAAEVPNPNSYSGLLNSNISAWGNASCFHSAAGQFTERLFDHEVARPINFDDRNLPLVSMGNMNMGRKVNEDPFGIDPSFGLSISHPLEDPRSGVNYGGIRKVKVSQVKDAGNFMSVSMGHSYSSGDNSSMASAHAYSKADDNTITMGLSFNRGNDNMMMDDTFNREDSNFITMSQPFNKGDNSEISMGLAYRENTGSIPIGHSVSKDNTDNAAIAHAFIKGGANGVQMSTFKENNNSIPVVVQAFSKDDCDITSLGNTFNQGVCNTILMGNKVDDHTISGKVDTSNLSIGHSFSKGESNIISFGGLNDDDDDPSGRLICSYDLLMGQNLVQRSEELAEKGLVELNATALGSAVQIIASGETVSKKKEEQKATKKAPPNNFPSNVRSLLSTGMLDGVPVKYIAWSREELRAIIKGSAYLCGCQSCSYSKAINAYEFERHAGCKTKHPNNHIYFENGKTVYGIVQELRNTPQSLLFDVIQTITGSPINQKSFRLWKESFLAATRELQRIYGKEEGKILS